jgi:transcriptional regulator with XRE-family HTH domain
MATRTLGERIRELREKLDLSLRELGQKLADKDGKPKSAAFLSDVELGRRYPSPELLAEMARALRTTLEDLKSYDSRAPVEELKRLAIENPAYGMALRQVIDKNLSAEDLMGLVNRTEKKREK